jgi:hypothetical protein
MCREKRGFGRVVSRILCRPKPVNVICLGDRYPGSASLSRRMARAAPGSPIWPCSRGGLPCPVACASGGGLLPRRFTLARPAVSREPGGLRFLWHFLSGAAFTTPACGHAGLPAKATPRRRARFPQPRALWSSDFPPVVQDDQRRSTLPKPAWKVRLGTRRVEPGQLNSADYGAIGVPSWRAVIRLAIHAQSTLKPAGRDIGCWPCPAFTNPRQR